MAEVRTSNVDQAHLSLASLVMLLAVAAAMVMRGQGQLLATCLMGGALLLVVAADKRLGIVTVFLYLFFLGDIRRLVNMFLGWPGLDPMLLVAPAVALWLALPLLLRPRLRSRLSQAVILLMGIMMLQVLNPAQGGLKVGIAGAMFYLVPMFWFWIGRRYGDAQFVEDVLLKLVVFVGVLAAALGLWQTFVGFLPWEQAWIDHVGSFYAALNLGGSIRAFGFFSSSQSYATFLSLAIAMIAVAWMTRRSAMVLWLPLLLPALVLASGRSSVVRLLVAVAVVWAVRKPHAAGWYWRFAFALLVGVVGMAIVLSHLSGVESGNAAAQAALSHQVGGLMNPLDSRESTLLLHLKMMLYGVVHGILHPLGLGLGATTLAAVKFGGVGYNAEVDISNMFLSLGVVGGLLYLAIWFMVLHYVFDYWRRSGSVAGLVILIVLIVTLASWLIAGMYGVTAFVWFLIGTLDRLREEARASDAAFSAQEAVDTEALSR